MQTTNYNVTKTEFKELASQYWNGEITQQEIDKYNIVLSVQPNSHNEEINKLINNLCTDHRQDANRIVYTGFFNTGYGISQSPYFPNGFKYISNWSNGYREVFTSEANLCIVTTCEGDLSIELYPSQEAYNDGIKRCEKFYDEN